MVSGGAALWYQKHPWGGPSAATDAVEETARQLDYPGQPYDGKLGEGRLDVAALVMQSGIGN
jgi:hypothetical protein